MATSIGLIVVSVLALASTTGLVLVALCLARTNARLVERGPVVVVGTPDRSGRIAEPLWANTLPTQGTRPVPEKSPKDIEYELPPLDDPELVGEREQR